MAKRRASRRSPAPAAATPAPATASTALASVLEGVVASLARDSFALVSNPRRRRLRKGDGAFHCDYRTVDELRNISRWLEYHSATYGGALANWANYLVGDGPTWVPSTGDPEWNRQAAALIADDFEAKRHDVRRRFTWARWLKLAAISIARDGMIGISHTVTGAAQLIEAERILTCDTNRDGQVVAWQVADIRNGWLDLSTKRPLPPAMFDVAAVVTRVSQDLGIPICYSSLDDHDGIADLWQAEIDSAAESVRPWLRIEHVNDGLPGGATIGDVLTAGQPIDGPHAPGRAMIPEGWIRTPNGNIMGIPKGLKSEVHQPERPNLDVTEFTKQVMRICCMVLLPYELLFVDQADISYANGRSVRKIGNSLLNAFRADHLNAPCKRIVQGLLRQRMLRNELPFRKDWAAGALKWSEIPEHDRVKERQADTIDLANGTASLKDLRGEAWQATIEQRAVEYGRAAELVAKHNAAHPTQPITVAHLIGDPIKIAAVSASVAGASTPADQVAATPPAGAAAPATKDDTVADPVGAGATDEA